MIIAFYYSENKSNLKNKDGKNLQFEFDNISPYQFSLWPDVSIFVPYTDLNMSSGFKGILSYDIIILDENSHLLARSKIMFSFIQISDITIYLSHIYKKLCPTHNRV